ncbi:MAG TPA: glycosyltransferase, partial [Fibrobacteria bacterium]|nr:glycosyltransferase [Fibrobacteria bacterium]
MSKSRPPRILFLTTDYPPDLGGLQTYSYRIARSLPGGLVAGVVVGSDHPSAALPTPAAIPLRAFRGRDRLRAAVWSLRAVLLGRLHGRIDCSLHMQWSTALGPWLLAKARRPMPYVILIHGAELLDPGRPLLARLKASVFAEAAAVVAGSHATADLFTSLGLRARRLEVIHYGNPLEAPRPSEPRRRSTGPVRILAMHRLVARKGTSLLLDSLAGLGPLDWRLDLVGRGEEETALRAQATALGLADRI